MGKYLIKATYAPQGAKGLMKEGGSGRRDAIEKLAREAGGTMESFYFGFGDVDAYVTVDLPGNAAAAGVALAVNSSGAAHTETVVLLTPEEVDEAAKGGVDYRPPGG
jgi:uncharacterized protein with GYD domain